VTNRAHNPLIMAGGLTRIYSLGDTQVIGIHGIDLDIRRGELVVLKGNSGSGKSTLLSLIAGLDRPTDGHLTVAGNDLNRITTESLTRFRREVVGMVFQSFNLLPTLNVMENVCLPALLAGKPYAEIQDKTMELLAWLDLKPRSSHLPGQLSGGEMQRTAIARALINDPDLILADEPTGNLDSRNGEMVIELLVALNRKFESTVFIATHSSLADRFASVRIHLKDGKIANYDTA
jgi:putative ABC transport system ATP-binding protein